MKKTQKWTLYKILGRIFILSSIAIISTKVPAQEIITEDIETDQESEKEENTDTYLDNETESDSEEYIPVADIEISDYANEIDVDSVMILDIKVLPTDATKQEVTYSSSDERIATVNSSGEVKGIAPGEVMIYISADDVTKIVSLVVKIPTSSISCEESYLVLKSGEQSQIKATVYPSGARNILTYKSLDKSVAEVSESGLITAKGDGNTAIIVSNGELQTMVTVIVNQESISKEDGNTGSDEFSEDKSDFNNLLSVEDYPVIFEELLKYLYQTGQTLVIKGDGYNIYIDGTDIVNYNNELYTDLQIEETGSDFSFIVNRGNELCGNIIIEFEENRYGGKYLYLYNESRHDYQLISVDDISYLSINTPGSYLITNEKLRKINIKKEYIMFGGIGMAGVGGTFILKRRKYWLW